MDHHDVSDNMSSSQRSNIDLNRCILYWTIGCCLLSLTVSTADDFIFIQKQWKECLGTIIPRITGNRWNLPVIAGILIANTPQLLLSLVYLFYNGLFTCILVSAEWTSYAHEKKSLRVSRPKGQQRSTYFLSLPYRFSIPLVAASVAFHWMLSQSLFLAQLNAYDQTGKPCPQQSLHTVSWSPLALMVLVVVGGLLIVGLVAFGFRRYRSGIPLVLSDTRAISAACHPTASNESLKELQYGIISRANGDKRHVGFSSGRVEALVDGDVYIRLYTCIGKNMIMDRIMVSTME